MDRKHWFRDLSLLIERAPIEIFIFEVLIIIILIQSAVLLLEIIFGVFITGVLAESAKLVVREKRPKNAAERKVYSRTFRLNRRSFPSAHTAIAMFFPGLLFGTFLFIPTLVFGVFIGYTRLYLKDHFLRDVVAGGAIGLIIGYLVPMAFIALRHMI